MTSTPNHEFDAVELAYLREVLDSRSTLDALMKDQGRLLRGGYLRGRYPDTELVLAWIDLGTGEEEVMTMQLWPGFKFFGEPMSPTIAASIIATNILEP